MNTRQIFAVATLVGAVLASASAAMAHSGHEHAAEPPPPVARSGLGAAGLGEHFEIVIKVADGGGSLVYLADLDTSAPVAGAAVEVEAEGTAMIAAPTASPGIYRLAWEMPARPVDLTVTVSAAGRDDLLLLTGVARPVAPQSAAVAAGFASPADWKGWLAGGGAVAALLGVGMIARRRGFAGAALVLLGLAAAGPAFAHAGEDHGDGGAPTTQAAVVPGRAVTMPKESQFLLGVRTGRAEAREVAEAVRLVGRVVPDPTGYARVQPAQAGRVVWDPDHPLPVPGQSVKRGDVLAVIEPNLTALERSDQRAALYRVETAIAQTERQIRRWEQMGDAARRKDLDDARLDLARLVKEREQIAGTALGREYLRAPLDGVVTDVHVVPGEVIAPETTAIEVVDPERLRVEAVLHDLALADRIAGGQASTRLLKDHVFSLSLIGSGGRIDPRDQGLHLIFAVTDGARLLKLGLPLDVLAHTGGSSLRVSVPREAIADAGGRPVVFVKTAPEIFEARPVRLGRVVGGWAEVAEDVAPGERVVVRGAAQLAAMR